MLIVSCTQEMEPLNKESEVMEFHAYLTDNPQSKTIRQEDGKVFWSPHEDIHIFQGSRSGKFTSQNEEISATATFTGTMNNDVDNGTDYWAVYPWDNDNLFWGGVVGVPIQSYQRTQSGSFVDEVYPSVAKSSTNHLQFYNICGGIKFRVFNPGIKQVVFRGNNDEVVAGLALIAFSEGKPVLYGMGNTMSHPSSKNIFVSAPDESGFIPGKYYYIVIPPIVFDNGFSLVFCNSENQEATFSTDKKITVSRSKFGVLNDLDEGLVFTEGEEAQRVLEKSALIAIYNSLNGNNWLDKTNWLSNSPVGTWSGVTTDENGFVSELRLNDINLQGVFPVEICQLSYLSFASDLSRQL